MKRPLLLPVCIFCIVTRLCFSGAQSARAQEIHFPDPWPIPESGWSAGAKGPWVNGGTGDSGPGEAREPVANLSTGYANETRLFLTSNESILADLYGSTSSRYGVNKDVETQKNWNGIAPGARKVNGEFKLDLTVPALSDGYLLEDCASNYHSSTSLSENKSNILPSMPPSNSSLNCDFIYRLEQNLPRGVRGSTVLFQVEFILYKKTGTNAPVVDRTIVKEITLDDYNAFVGSSHPQESPDILLFPMRNPSIPSLAHKSPRSYAIVHHSFDVGSMSSTGWDDKNPTADGWTYCGLDCRLKRLAAVPIYVRGLRLRSDVAQEATASDPHGWSW